MIDNMTDGSIQNVDLLENIPTGIGIYDVTGDIIEMKYLNGGYYRMIGAAAEDRDQFRGTELVRAIHADDLPGLLREAKASVTEQRLFQYRFRVLAGSGGYIWIGIRASHEPISETTERFYAAYYNVDAYLNAQKQLEQDNKTIYNIIDNIPGGVAVFADINGRMALEYTNEGFYSLHHGSREYWKTVSDDPVDWLFAEDRSLFYDEFRRVQKGQKAEGNVSYRVLSEDGQLHWVNNQFKYAYEHDGIKYYYSSFVSLDDEKSIEEDILKTQQMYDDATEDAQMIIWTYDMKNHRALMMQSGYTKMICERLNVPAVIENVPESLLQFVHEEDRRLFLKIYRNIDEGREISTGDFRFKMPAHDSMQYERITLKRIYNDSGELLAVYSCGQNITSLKQKEEKFNRAYSQLDNPNSYGSFHLNLTRNICGDGKKGRSNIENVLDLQNSGTVDGYFHDFSSLIADDHVKKRFHGIFDRKILLDKYKSGVETVSIEYPVVYANGERHWREGFLDMMENPNTGDIEGVTYSYDIDRKKRDELIVENLINVSFDYIGVIHPENRTFELRSKKPWIEFGTIGGSMDFEECRRHMMNKITDADEREKYRESSLLENIQAGLENSDKYTATYRVLEGGKMRTYRRQYSWLEGRGGDILVIGSDITDVYEQEQKYIREIKNALLEAENASSAKSDFVSRISHDIRTPISAIISMTKFAKEDLDNREKLVKDLNKIEASNAFLLSLINDILDISKIDSGKIELEPEPYPFDEYIDKVRSMFEPLCLQKGLELKIISNREYGACALVDKVRLNQITMNLLSNAVKYTEPGGTITYLSESKILDDGMMRCKFIISDTGIGMSEEFQKSMFEAFAQESNEYRQDNSSSGSGLGLAIVKRIVDLMDGDIEVESRPGEGTSIAVTLVLPQATSEEISAAAKCRENKTADVKMTLPLKLLLAEDNTINREIANRLLTGMGARVKNARNGAEAVELFRNSAVGEYDAILMDIQMPVMNGYDAAEKVRSMNRADAKSIPIIAMTADAFAGAVQQSIRVGMNDYITKPIDENLLKAKLIKWTKHNS